MDSVWTEFGGFIVVVVVVLGVIVIFGSILFMECVGFNDDGFLFDLNGFDGVFVGLVTCEDWGIVILHAESSLLHGPDATAKRNKNMNV